MASCHRHIAASKPRFLKHLFFPTTSKPLYRFFSSTNKPPIEQNPHPKSPLSTPKSQSHIIHEESSTPPDKTEDEICRILQDDERSTNLQTSIRKLVPFFDHNVISNVLIRIPNRAFEFFQFVEKLGFKHNQETHHKIIHILCRDRRFDDAKQILLGISKNGLDYNEDLFVLLIQGYAKSNRKWDIVKNCVKIFLKMEEMGVPRTIMSYNVLLEVIISCKKYTMAEKYFKKMLSEGIVPTQHSYNLMVLGFCSSSRVETANLYFQDMKNRNFLPDFVLYNAMINGYVRVMKMEEAEKMLMEMKGQEIEPLLATYNSMINGYTRGKRLVDAENVLAEMKSRNVEPNLVTYNTMINGYALVEKMGDAQKLVWEMKGRNIEPDLVTYVTMVKGYVTANMVDEGLELVEEMKGKRFGKKVDVNLCLGVLNDECDVEKMSETQRSVLRVVEEYVERVDLLAMRDAARELSELANKRLLDRQGHMKMDSKMQTV